MKNETLKRKSITAFILGQNFVVEELEADKNRNVIICYEKRNLWNRLRLWLSQKIRPEITAIIPINANENNSDKRS